MLNRSKTELQRIKMFAQGCLFVRKTIFVHVKVSQFVDGSTKTHPNAANEDPLCIPEWDSSRKGDQTPVAVLQAIYLGIQTSFVSSILDHSSVYYIKAKQHFDSIWAEQHFDSIKARQHFDPPNSNEVSS